MSESYTIGLDFGTLSGRAVLVRVSDGKIVADAENVYAHGVMSACLPDGTPLGQDWALQHPQDYLDVLTNAIPEVMRKSGVDKARVMGIGIDFTGSTPMPVDENGTPLCLLDKWAHTPHAYVKLWKHHAAVTEAALLTAFAAKYDPEVNLLGGGKISTECLLPKAFQVLREAPEVYAAADRFMEAGEWVAFCLTGQFTRSAAMATLKSFWRKGRGYPAFVAQADKGLGNLFSHKLRAPVVPLGGCAGKLTKQMAQKLGLQPGTPVGVPQFDAHAAVPAVGIDGAGVAMLTLGTSSGVIVCGDGPKGVEGVGGMGYEVTLPGLFGYGSGQYSCGDMLSWFVKNQVPASYSEEAAQKQLDIHQLLTQKAAVLKPCESGLLALDWWNGCRSVLVDSRLTGLIIGLTLQTRPEEIYRALLEAIAFGLHRIFASYEMEQVPIREVRACGGISRKNPLLMQLCADITGKPIHIASISQSTAVGAAMLGAVAAGKQAGGWDTLAEASKHMNCLSATVYTPNPQAQKGYEPVYKEFITLYDYFGRGANDVMHRLKENASLTRTEAKA